LFLSAHIDSFLAAMMRYHQQMEPVFMVKRMVVAPLTEYMR